MNPSSIGSERAVLGKAGEDLVARHLTQQGFNILARNYRKRYGEIDLIAVNRELLVFVEVKRRLRSYSGFDLSEVVSSPKQHKMIKVAREFMARFNHDDKNCRFDVALVEGEGTDVKLTYIPHAFEGSEF